MLLLSSIVNVMKKNTKKIGDLGEEKAVLELEKSGYKIISRNWRTRFGEIDIIAKDGEELVFVEVKAKADDFFGTPAEMITHRKLEKVVKTAESYITEERYEGPWRIDAVAIEGDKIEILKSLTS